MKSPEELSETELAYIAGIIDGEGHIGLTIQKKKNQAIAIAALLSVNNGKREIIDWLTLRLGGKVRFYQHNGSTSWNGFYLWANRSPQEIGIILKAIRPYLVIKRDQADIFLEWLQTRTKRQPSGLKGVYTTIPEADLALVRKLRDLKIKPNRRVLNSVQETVLNA